MIEHYGKATARFDEIQNFLIKTIDVIIVTYKDNIQKAIKKLSKKDCGSGYPVYDGNDIQYLALYCIIFNVDPEEVADKGSATNVVFIRDYCCFDV